MIVRKMNNENNRSAAGLRRSAIAERIRLREEWSALKEIDKPTTSQNVLKKKPMNSRQTPFVSNKKKKVTVDSSNKENQHHIQVSSDTLKGVVALVDVGSEARALPLRAVLTALGATVVTAWSPLVTHLVWNDNGSRSIRARARALACRVVSPLWVEACAAAENKLREKMFPAASRQSDLPSPRTLRFLLKKAERENVALFDLLDDSKEDDMPRLRFRTSESDTSREKTTDVSNETTDLESRINTAPRRGLTSERGPRPGTEPTATRPAKGPPATRPPPKSRRKLFTHKEAQDLSSTDENSDSGTRKVNRKKAIQTEKRDLARAAIMARKILASCNTQKTNNNNITATQSTNKPRIVLTGMTSAEREAITTCIHKLGGVIQNAVNKRTTHVLLGSCNINVMCDNHGTNITGVSSQCDLSKTTCWSASLDPRARTLSALAGAARGGRVLRAGWAVCSAEKGSWLHHHGYEVPHLRRICQKARVERFALGHQNSEYAYDVFNGMKVRVTDDADQKDAAKQLLTLCGAILQDGGNSDVIIGNSVGEVHSKWVFDSVAAARMRTTRRYINSIRNSIRFEDSR